MHGTLLRSPQIFCVINAAELDSGNPFGLTLEAFIINEDDEIFNFTLDELEDVVSEGVESADFRLSLPELTIGMSANSGYYRSSGTPFVDLPVGNYTVFVQNSGGGAGDGLQVIQAMYWDGSYWSHGGTSASLTDINEEPVNSNLTWLVKATTAGLTGEFLRATADGSAPLYAIDFREVMPAGSYISQVNSISILTGTSGGVTFGTAGKRGSQAKVAITAVTPGDYVIRCKVTFRGGSTAIADVELTVTE